MEYNIKATSNGKFHLYAYSGSGSAYVTESNEQWDTREDAQAAADRINAGDKTGITFAMFSDD